MERRELVSGVLVGLVVGFLVGYMLFGGVKEPETGLLEEQMTEISTRISELESLVERTEEMSNQIEELEETILSLDDQINSLELQVLDLSETDEIPVIVNYREVDSWTSEVNLGMTGHEVYDLFTISNDPMVVKWEFSSGDTSDIQIIIYADGEVDPVHSIQREGTTSGEVRFAITPGEYLLYVIGSIEFTVTVEEPV